MEIQGTIKVKYTGGYNADGTPKGQSEPDDRQIMSVDPNFQGGFNTRVAYKGFDLTLLVYLQRAVSLSARLLIGRLPQFAERARGNVKVDYWTPENTGATYPKPGGVSSGDNPKYGSTLDYFSGSYLKIRTISLGYNFNQEQLDKKSDIQPAALLQQHKTHS